MSYPNQLSNPAAAAWPVVVNENLSTQAAHAMYARNYLTSTLLTLGYFGGHVAGSVVADATVSLTNTATNYVVAHRSTGAVTAATSTTNWNDTATYGRLFKATAAGGVVTALEDWRQQSGGWFDRSGSAAAYGNAYDIRDFGTLANDGSTDDSAVFIAAAASGARVIHAENLNCAILSTVNIPANQVWVMSGSKFTQTGSTATMFKADTVDDWALIGPFTCVGSGSTVGTAKGVHVVGCNRWKVDHYTAKSIKGWGFYLQPGTPSGTLRADQGYLQNFRAESCYVGYEDTPGAGAEYGTLLAPHITGCGTGLITAAGNVQVIGGQIADNTGDGVRVNASTNHAHGQFIGVNINHNAGYNLRCTGVVNGEDFIGCHFYEFDIFLDGCKGVVIRGGHVDCDIVNDSGTGSGQNYLLDAYCPSAYGSGSGGKIAVSGNATSALTVAGMMGAGAPSATGIFCTVQLALSDESTAVTAGTGKVTFRMPHAMTLFPGNAGIRLSATTAPTGASLLTVDVNEAGSTILSTKLTLDASEKTSTTAATPPVISDVDLADDAEMTVDFDQVGSTIAGAGLKLLLRGTRPVNV